MHLAAAARTGKRARRMRGGSEWVGREDSTHPYSVVPKAIDRLHSYCRSPGPHEIIRIEETWKMKVIRWTRGLLLSLAAGGAIGLGTASGAPLDTNLVTNGDFENVDLNSTGNYGGPRILDWSGLAAFAYSHDGSSTAAGVVPDYANGAAPPNAGHWYFTANNGVPDITAADQFYQDIDVSAGDTGATIAMGLARYHLSAAMSSFDRDRDYGNVHLAFLDPASNLLGDALLVDSDRGVMNVWTIESLEGSVPIGTSSIRLSLFGTPIDLGPDGYIDNVTLSISVVPEPGGGLLGSVALAVGGMATRRRRMGAGAEAEG